MVSIYFFTILTGLIGRDKKSLEEERTHWPLACTIQIPPGREKYAKSRQKLPVPLKVLPLHPCVMEPVPGIPGNQKAGKILSVRLVSGYRSPSPGGGSGSGFFKSSFFPFRSLQSVQFRTTYLTRYRYEKVLKELS